MPEFIMDRDGVVNGMEFADLSDIFQGYVEAMLFTETAGHLSMVDWDSDETQEAVREGTSDGTIPGDSGWGDIQPESAERAQIDVFNFEAEARALLDAAYARGYDRHQAGRDFWLTRNGHGAGFWDRQILDADDLGDKLSAIARTYGEVCTDFIPDELSPTGYGFVYMS